MTKTLKHVVKDLIGESVARDIGNKMGASQQMFMQLFARTTYPLDDFSHTKKVDPTRFIWGYKTGIYAPGILNIPIMLMRARFPEPEEEPTP